MTYVDEVRVARFRKEANKWIETEMEARMAAAVKEIATQAEAGSNALPEEVIEKHITDATKYAEQEIRRELEMEADKWVERKLQDAAEMAASEADNPCGGCRGCCG